MITRHTVISLGLSQLVCWGTSYYLLAALLFTFLFGAGNGLMTITRGTLPLVLFDHKIYGALVGKLLVPGFLLSAVSPIVYTYIISRFGEQTTFFLSAIVAFIIFLL